MSIAMLCVPRKSQGYIYTRIIESSLLDWVLQEMETGVMRHHRICVDQFPLASQLVNELMAATMEALMATPILRDKLFQARLSTSSNPSLYASIVAPFSARLRRPEAGDKKTWANIKEGELGKH